MAVSLVLGVIGIVVKVLYKRMKANAPDVPLSNLTSVSYFFVAKLTYLWCPPI